MPDIRTFLDQREQQLEAEIAKLRSMIAPLERELFEVKVAKRAVGRQSREPVQRALFTTISESDEDAAALWKQYSANEGARASSPYGTLTIKQLVTMALKEQFPSGATANQLLELFENAWGRGDIVRTSLSPQLSRLRADGIIDRNGPLWYFRTVRKGDDEKAAADQ